MYKHRKYRYFIFTELKDTEHDYLQNLQCLKKIKVVLLSEAQ